MWYYAPMLLGSGEVKLATSLKGGRQLWMGKVEGGMKGV
jgi:hypothetical protein